MVSLCSGYHPCLTHLPYEQKVIGSIPRGTTYLMAPLEAGRVCYKDKD